MTIKSFLETAIEELNDADEQPTYERKAALIYSASRAAQEAVSLLEYEYRRLNQELLNSEVRPPVDSGKL